MSRHRVIRVGVLCAALCAASVIVAGSTTADPPPRYDFMAAALAIPSVPGTNTDDAATRFDSAHGHTAEINGVATTSLTCGGCSGHAVNLQVVYASRPNAVTANNVATAWASDCDGCRGWALSLQIVVAKSVTALTAANRALAFTAGCDGCDLKAAAVQIAVVAAPERQLTPQQMDSIRAFCDELVADLNSSGPASAQPAPSRTAAVPARSRAITATAEQIQSVVVAALGASSATHKVSVED